MRSRSSARRPGTRLRSSRRPSSLWDFLPAYDGWVSHVLLETAETVPACWLEEKPGLLTRFRELASGPLDIRVNPFAFSTYGDHCTYYAESRMAQQTGKFMVVYGQPYQWAAQARLGGWTMGSKPEVNAVAVFPRNGLGLLEATSGWCPRSSVAKFGSRTTTGTAAAAHRH